jgi:hypothetical protein
MVLIIEGSITAAPHRGRRAAEPAICTWCREDREKRLGHGVRKVVSVNIGLPSTSTERLFNAGESRGASRNLHHPLFAGPLLEGQDLGMNSILTLGKYTIDPEEPFRTRLKKRWCPEEMRVAPALPDVPATCVQPRTALLINPFYPRMRMRVSASMC